MFTSPISFLSFITFSFILFYLPDDFIIGSINLHVQLNALKCYVIYDEIIISSHPTQHLKPECVSRYLKPQFNLQLKAPGDTLLKAPGPHT